MMIFKKFLVFLRSPRKWSALAKRLGTFVISVVLFAKDLVPLMDFLMRHLPPSS